MPAGLRGKVVAYDPKWNFAVVNVGREQGAKLHGELLIGRSGGLVGRLVIVDIDDDRCIANVVPGWRLAEVTEGDVVMPAHPES